MKLNDDSSGRLNSLNDFQHFFFDGYDVDNTDLCNTEYVNQFLIEVNEKLMDNKCQITIIPYFNGKVKEDGGVSGILLGNNFHLTCHTFCYKNTLFIDCYGKINSEKELMPIILKHFKTDNFDLCNNNDMKNDGKFGKHIIINYDDPLNYGDAKKLIKNILVEIEMTPICDVLINYTDELNYDIIQLIAESYISVHRTEQDIMIDVFSCKFFDNKKLKKLVDYEVEKVYQIQRGINYK